MNEIKLICGQKIAIARTRAGLSQFALAKKAGIARATLNMIECGHVCPRLSTVTKLAEALHANVNELV